MIIWHSECRRMWLYSWIQVGTQAFGAIRKAGTVVVVGLSNEREGAPVPGFNAITVAMFQKRIQGSLYGMGSPRDADPTC